MKRNETLDIIKGVAIIVVVALHASVPFSWLHLFQMSVFFMVAGFCYNPKSAESFSSMKTYVLKRVRSLYVPCVIFSLSVTLLHNVLIDIYIIEGNKYTIKNFLVQAVKSFCFSGGGNLSGTIWFLRTMFIASVFFLIIDRVTRKSTHAVIFRWLICIVALAVGWGAYFYKIPGSEYFNSFTVLFMYEIGRTVRQFDIRLFYPGHQKQFPVWVNIVVMLFTGILLWALDKVVVYSLNKNIIPQPLGLVLGTTLGWLFITAVGNLFGKTFLKKPLAYLGKHTLIVMLFHFSCFKLITALQIIIYNEEWTQLSSFPCLYTENGWWMAYTIIGVVIPILLYLVYHAVVSSVKRLRNKE